MAERDVAPATARVTKDNSDLVRRQDELKTKTPGPPESWLFNVETPALSTRVFRPQSLLGAGSILIPKSARPHQR